MTNKKVYFEFMRVMACALVIFNHIEGYLLYGISSGPKQFFYMTITMITRINVPLFFMISGALLLEKQEPIKLVYKKRVSRIVIVMLIIEFLYYLIASLRKMKSGVEITSFFGDYIKMFLKGNVNGAYWYLYAYLGFLCVLPFMQRIAQGMRKQEFAVILGINFITSSFLPLLNVFLNKANIGGVELSGYFNVPFVFIKAFFYPLIGYYIEHNIAVDNMKKKSVLLLILAGILGILLSNYCTYNEGKTLGKYTQNYVQLFDYLTAIVAFIVIKYFFVKKKNKENSGFNKIICFCGTLTFGIYLFDPILRNLFYSKYNVYAKQIMPTIFGSIGWVIISMIVCGTVTFLLKKIPGIKKLL